MKNSISKSVWAIVAIGAAVVFLVVWFGLRPAAPLPPPNSPEIKVEAVASTAVASAVPAAPIPVADQTDGGIPAVVPISLTNVLIDAENGSWLRDKDYLLAPHLPQEFGGVLFLMDGMIQLQGKMSKDWKNRSYRSAVVLPLALTNISASGTEIIQRGRNVASLHLLGATRYGSNQQKTFVEIIWRYTDGTALRTPVEYDTHFRDWVRNPYEEPAHLAYPFTKVVWTVPQPSQPTHALRLYRTSFANPAPKKIIRQLEFNSDMEDPTLFIVGVTLDPLKLGERPDLSADLEPTDPFPALKLDILVQDQSGQPIPQAKLQTVFQQQVEKKPVRTSGFLTADAYGSTHVNYPPQDLDQLSISVSHDDFGGRKMVWDLKAGDMVPSSYIIKLGSGLNIGGTVVDESAAPVADAKISLYRFWTGNDEINKKGEQADFPSQTATTDAAGTWQAKGLPTELLANIGFDVKHPEFIGTNITVGENGTTESQLRAGTFKIVLHHGLAAHGLVTDDNDNPIAGATVWSGEKYSRDRQQTKTGDDGKFSLQNISAGDVVFSVSAAGRQPDSKTFTVKTDMPDIVFKLTAGKTIRAVVQDENAAPVAGVRVELEGEGEIGRTYEFSATTDKDGRFNWDSAPDEPMQFYFGKEGYEAKRNVKLAPEVDNTVTLHNPRQLQGQVLDADTGQPVTKFSTRTGHRQDATSDNIYGVIKNQDFSAPDGNFTLSLDEENDDAIQVTSDDYSQQVQSFPEAQGGIIQMTIRLKSSPALHGIVTAPDGTPLPGVSVAVTTDTPGSGGVSLQGTHLRSWSNGSKISITDDQGKFTVGSLPDSGGTVVAVGDLGFVSASVDQVRANPTLVLQPWGRIEGTLTIGGQPGVGKDLLFNVGNGVQTDFNGYKTTTDEQGKFTFEKVPPGDGAIIRLVSTTPNSWTWSDSTSVTVQPGATTQVALGDHGAVLNGTVRFEIAPTNAEALSIQGNLSGQMPQQPSFDSPAEAQAFYQSPEWKAQTKLVKHYAFGVNPDGTFTVDDVAPGSYSLNVTVQQGRLHPWEHPPLAQGSAPVIVPDSFSPSSPIDVGEVLLKANSPQ